MTQPGHPGGRIMVAVDSAIADLHGERVNIYRGTTTVREGHPLYVKHPELFRLLEPTFDVPDPAEGEESAPRSQVRADQRGARTR